MAREQKDIAKRQHQRGAQARAAGVTGSDGSPPTPQPQSWSSLALSDYPPQHQDQILALVRALAQDAARRDHESATDQLDPHKLPGK